MGAGRLSRRTTRRPPTVAACEEPLEEERTRGPTSPAAADENEREEPGAPLAPRLRGGLPVARWLATYRPEWVRADAVSGVTLAAYAIPVSLAYATIAGLPP